MRQLQPVIWTKGTFLSPQHLQAQERFVEDSARFYLEALKSKIWGFLELHIDSKAVAEGTIAVTRASGIFPDALSLDLPLSDQCGGIGCGDLLGHASDDFRSGRVLAAYHTGQALAALESIGPRV